MAILNNSDFTFFSLWNEEIKWYLTLWSNQEVCIGVDLMFLIRELLYHLAGSGSWRISMSLY